VGCVNSVGHDGNVRLAGTTAFGTPQSRLFFEPFEHDVPGLSGARLRLDPERHSGGIQPGDAGLGRRRAAQPRGLWTKRDDDDRSDDHRHAIDEDRLLRSCLVLLGVTTELERVPVFGFAPSAARS
jgi:hypothetical protein